jgi:exodeoxyribonuclease VII large subunit
MRATLVHMQTIECIAYLTKRVQLVSALIELQVNIVELLAQTESKYSDLQIKGFEILQRKVDFGYRDVDSFIKTKILKGEPIKITISIGRTGIIDSDIKHQLQEAIGFYEFIFVRISLTSEAEISAALNTYQDTDILVISRGGGDNLEIFDTQTIAEASLHINPYFVTAIGHKENSPLLQKIADKSFITPTALGQHFNDIYNETIEQLQNSKAKLVADITTQIKTNYDKQLQNLSEKLKQTEDLHSKTLENFTSLYQQEVEMLKKQIEGINEQDSSQLTQIQNINEEKVNLAKIQMQAKTTTQSTINLVWILVVIALVVGLLIGKDYH